MKKKIMGLSLICVLTVFPFTSTLAQTGVSNSWTAWLDRDNPSGEGDAEVLPSFLTETPSNVCTSPSAVEARIKGSTQVFTPGMITPHKLRAFAAGKGLQCYNVDQASGGCADYEVRFLCAAPTLGQTKSVLNNVELFQLETATAQGNAIAQAKFKLDDATRALNGRFSFDMEGKITAFNDLGEGADEKSGDGIFSAFTTIDVADINNTRTAFLNKLSTVKQPQVSEFSGRALISTKTFAVSSSVSSVSTIKGLRVVTAPSPLPAATPPALVNPSNALVINDTLVVANPSLTFDVCNSDGIGNNVNPNAAWSFKTLISNLNNEATSGMTDQQFANDWLRSWINNQNVNSFLIPARGNIKDYFQGWDGVNASTLNMDRLPFRLLAIVNRIDLASIPAYGTTAANKPGEIRFVFGLLSRNNSGQCVNGGIPFSNEMTAIFEYKDATTNCAGLKDLANKWIALDSLGVSSGRGSAAYLNALKAITDTVTAPNVDKLNQLRTNDFAFDGFNSFMEPWQLREFVINPTSKRLVSTTIKQTPEPARFRQPGTGTPDELLMKSYLDSEASNILCESHQVPEIFNSQPFLGGHADYESVTTWTIRPNVSALPTAYPGCYQTTIVPGTDAGLSFNDRMTSEIRHKFAVNTCDDCHAAETATRFVHISPINRQLSGFMQGIEVTDPRIPSLKRKFNDLARRNQALVGTAATSCTTDPRILSSFQARQARLGFIH
ncbi:hypothetical protein [Cellvibrio mixtus]|uniref:hypothetical protein n=1 Tax=Cellvibrio mixtus TaxID=39650 RepID=UPI0005879577|nr:hypothetical protein [Cellvibrio mixtus]